MIIAHLIYDTNSLLACSLTCHSWYAASVPHLHHTLVIRARQWPYGPEREWPNPLRSAGKLGLLPLVKKFRVQSVGRVNYGFYPKLFNYRILRHFCALTNVRELAIADLDIPNFIPMIQRYFGHFFPTLRSLSLRAPKGSRRQLIFFIGLFQHLEDLTLTDGTLEPWESEPVDDMSLIPPFSPSLRGRLFMFRFTRVGLVKEMVDLFVELRFRHMVLYDVDGTRLLLDACAKTLETLLLHPTDPRGEQL